MIIKTITYPTRPGEPFPRAWLVAKLTSNREAFTQAILANAPVEFGDLCERAELRAKLQQAAEMVMAELTPLPPEAELWWFKSPEESWWALAGRAGYAVLAADAIVSYTYTLIS